MNGSATFKACVDGDACQVTLREVYYAESSPWNIISYGKIEELGYEHWYDGPKRYLGRRSNVYKVFDVHKDARNVLVAKVVNAEAKDNIDYVIMALCEAVMLRIAMCSLAVYWIFIYVLAIFITTQLRAWHGTLTVKCLPHKERPTCGHVLTANNGEKINRGKKQDGRRLLNKLMVLL